MKPTKQFRRAFVQSFSYGIYSDDLTKREKRMWTGFLYALVGIASYYQLKDIARTSEQGEFSVLRWLKDQEQEPDYLLEEAQRQTQDWAGTKLLEEVDPTTGETITYDEYEAGTPNWIGS